VTRLQIGRRPAVVFVTVAAFSLTASAQDTSDISVTLRVQNGKTQFRLGEIIPVELSFQSRIASSYLVWTVPSRAIMGQEYDQFLVEPEQGTAIFRHPGVHGYNGPAFQPDPLGITPIKTALTLNDWIAIRQPGHYRITVETTRALHSLPGGRPGEPVMLRSNAVEIDAVAPEAGWVEARVKEASDIISRAGMPPHTDENEAARTLRFLGTREAAHALVRFHLDGPPGLQYEIIQGLRESPYRMEIIAELEAGIANPGAQVSQPQQVRSTLDSLKAQAVLELIK